jgi:hypothetical protein
MIENEEQHMQDVCIEDTAPLTLVRLIVTTSVFGLTM